MVPIEAQFIDTCFYIKKEFFQPLFRALPAKRRILLTIYFSLFSLRLIQQYTSANGRMVKSNGIIHEKSNTRTYDKFVEDWQHRMKSVVGISQRNMGKMCKWNEKAYNKKVWGNEINVGDQVLLRNFEKGGTGKLKPYWEKTVYSIYPKGRNKIKKVHRNNIMKQTKPNEKTNKARIIPRDLQNSEEETSTSEDDVIVTSRRFPMRAGKRRDMSRRMTYSTR